MVVGIEALNAFGGIAYMDGTRNVKIDPYLVKGASDSSVGKKLLLLDEIKEFHREYRWI